MHGDAAPLLPEFGKGRRGVLVGTGYLLEVRS